jgi:hypothetical protein
VALMGQLGEFHLHNIIALLQVEKQTGELAVENAEGHRVAFYLQDGQIIHAVNGIQAGFEAAIPPFAWTTGKFHFESYQPDIAPTITEGNTAIVTAGRQHAVEAAEVLARVPSVQMILKLVPHAQAQSGYINLAPDEWRFLTLVDSRRNLEALAGLLGRDHYAVRVIANRLLKEGLVEPVDPRRFMVRMVVQPIDSQSRPPGDPMVAFMDDLALDLLVKGQPRRRAQIRVLTAGDRSDVLLVEGRPDLADWLLLSNLAMARLQVARNDYIHVKLLEDEK